MSIDSDCVYDDFGTGGIPSNGEGFLGLGLLLDVNGHDLYGSGVYTEDETVVPKGVVGAQIDTDV
jgi:hypothetical protein